MRMDKLILSFLLVASCHGYRYFQDHIPNGDNVPHPCKDNFLWHGVGHKQPGGGGPRNPFGLDFAKYKKWTNELCRLDSDGDGRTNGEELGDPDCVWHPGIFPHRTKNITHPGICDPFGSPECAESSDWVSCDAGVFKCDATTDPDVKNFTLRFPPTHVPPTETNYYCMPFLLGNYVDMNQDYHLVATQPLINNTNVMHHIVLFACSDEVEMTPQARPCYMAQRGCSDIIGIWTLGLPGTCEYKDAGYLIGKSGSKKLVMQFHWTNPELRSDYIDSSGLTLFYTAKRRQYNAGMMLSGQLYLNIPPGSPRTVFESSCTADCTNKIITDNVLLTSGFSHMHYLGYMETVDQIRGGDVVRRLINDTNYSYDSPDVHTYHEPIAFRSGDVLKTTCVYRSVSKTRTTLYGEGSYDEMCFSLFSYFPKENLTIDSCHQWKTLDLCHFQTGENNGIIDGCDTGAFQNKSSPQFRKIINEVLDSCNHWGPCRPECPEVVKRIKNLPCFRGLLGEFTLSTWASERDEELNKFAHALVSCDHESEMNNVLNFPMASAASLPAASLLMSSLFSLYFLKFKI